MLVMDTSYWSSHSRSQYKSTRFIVFFVLDLNVSSDAATILECVWNGNFCPVAMETSLHTPALTAKLAPHFFFFLLHICPLLFASRVRLSLSLSGAFQRRNALNDPRIPLHQREQAIGIWANVAWRQFGLLSVGFARLFWPLITSLSLSLSQEPYLQAFCDCCSYRLDPQNPVIFLSLQCASGDVEPVVLPVIHSCECTSCQGG